jgi:hypothetical protein
MSGVAVFCAKKMMNTLDHTVAAIGKFTELPNCESEVGRTTEPNINDSKQ